MLHVFLHVCKVAEENRCLTCVPVLKDRRQATDCRNREAYTCVVYHVTQASPTLLVILNEATLYPIVSVLRLYY